MTVAIFGGKFTTIKEFCPKRFEVGQAIGHHQVAKERYI